GTSETGQNRILVPGLADYSRNTLVEFCSNDTLATDEVREMFPDRKGLPLDYARNLCDREGDGIFVHFEPKTPTAGAAFESPVQQFVQINRNVREGLKTAAAGGARG
ncbi:MAG: hypothetical protein ABL959_12470, partial [Pyrinomonadaceae bacterium]